MRNGRVIALGRIFTKFTGEIFVARVAAIQGEHSSHRDFHTLVCAGGVVDLREVG